jgi:DNA-binding PadR family transcriptional regulator
MKLSLLELQLLLVIKAQRPNAYVGSILDEMNNCTKRRYWHGTVYATLNRFEERSLVKKTLEGKPSPMRGGRRKLIWQLTALGRMTLAQTLRTIVPFLGTTGRLPQSQRTRKARPNPRSKVARGYLDLPPSHKRKHNRKTPAPLAPVGFFAAKP